MNNWENGSKLREKPRIIGNTLRKSREKQEKLGEMEGNPEKNQNNGRKLEKIQRKPWKIEENLGKLKKTREKSGEESGKNPEN